MKELKTTGVGILALFTSLATLICCVLPLVLVSLGLGVVVVGLITQFPILVTLSEYKHWIFIGAAVLLALTAWLLWRPSRTCPSDPKLAAWCDRIQRWNKLIFWLAVVVFLIGFVVTYIIVRLFF